MKIDRRLDRIPNFDSASKRYGVAEVVPEREIISKVWLIQTCLDQGREGACVGFGVTHALLSEPQIGDPTKYTEKFAREEIYYPAQYNDPWPGGEYPGAYPVYGGTSLLDGLKAAKSAEEISEYRWAFDLNDLLVGVGYYGPAVIGVNWYSGMQEPDRKDMIHATGRVMGGHCTLIYRVNHHLNLAYIHNSWGNSWGNAGKCSISFKDLEKLLREDGECAFITKAKK